MACGLADARFWPMSVHFRLGYAGDREMAMSGYLHSAGDLDGIKSRLLAVMRPALLARD
jgi:hypothetical protein